MSFAGRVPRLPFGICDGDMLQLICLFSPDLTRVIDVDPIERTWVVCDCFSGDIVFKIPNTFLTLNSKTPKQVV